MIENDYKISTKIFQAFLGCKYKAGLYYQKKFGIPCDYEILQNELLIKYKKEVAEKMSSSYVYNELLNNPSDFNKTKQNHHKLIINISVKDNIFDLNLDALEIKAKKLGESIRYEYVPTLFIHNEKIKIEDRMLLAFQSIALAKLSSKKIQHGKIVFGNNYKTQNIKLGTLIPKVKKIIKEIETLNEKLSEICLNKHCNTCEFQKECHEKAIEKDHLSLLGRMSEKEIKQWNKKGIFTVTQLSYNFRPRRRSKRAKNIYKRHYDELKALAIRENKIYIFEKPELPKGKVEIFLDVEGNPDEDFYYLIGLVVIDGKNQKEYSFWANNKDDEIKIFKKFLDVISQYNDFIIFHYGSYENKFLNKVQKKCDNKTELIEKIIKKCCNVLSFVYLNIYFPTYSNGLKDVGKFLGFEWSDKNASGIQSLVWRNRWENSVNEVYRNKLIKYNLEDCLGLKMVKEEIFQLNSVGTAKIDYVNENKEEFFVSEIGKLDNQFKQIRKFASLGYDNKKISLRKEKKSLVRGQAIIGHQAYRRIIPKPNKTIKIQSRRKCIYCKNDLKNSKQTLISQVIIDLVFMKNGIRKTIIEYIGNKIRCSDCKKLSIPKFFEDFGEQRLIGYNFMAWIIYLRMCLHLPYSTIIQSLNDQFNEKISQSLISRFIRYFSKNYKNTEKKIINKLLLSPFIHADETKINIQGVNQYVWVFTDGEHVVFRISETRESDVVHKLLKNYEGVLISDFYAGYDNVKCRQQKCWVHLIKDINNDLWKNQFDNEFSDFVQKLRDLILPIFETVQKHGLKKRNLHKFQKKIEFFYRDVVNQQYDSEYTLKYQKRLIRYKEGLFEFINHDNIPWNNNMAERAIRCLAIQRKISGSFYKSLIDDFLLLLSLSQTCRFQEKSFLKFLISKEKDLDKFKKSKSIRSSQKVCKTNEYA